VGGKAKTSSQPVTGACLITPEEIRIIANGPEKVKLRGRMSPITYSARKAGQLDSTYVASVIDYGRFFLIDVSILFLL
jgi:hypothetical protein